MTAISSTRWKISSHHAYVAKLTTERDSLVNSLNFRSDYVHDVIKMDSTTIWNERVQVRENLIHTPGTLILFRLSETSPTSQLITRDRLNGWSSNSTHRWVTIYVNYPRTDETNGDEGKRKPAFQRLSGNGEKLGDGARSRRTISAFEFVSAVRIGRKGLYERSKEDTTAFGDDLVTQRCEG